MKHLGRNTRDEDVLSREVLQRRAVEYVSLSRGVQTGATNAVNARKILQVNELTGIGFLHLDFKIEPTESKPEGTNAGEILLGRLETWSATSVIEAMLFDGSTIWIVGREIRTRCKVGQRYIVDLNGFYRK
ncbi:hypothetical protein ABPH35_02380 [Streptococcus sp. ZJ93]|uniref:hypothetical protein n=1 Tax=Streptococcus handemini TaxID=3161188 RepID=UPI0034D78B56